MKVVIPDELYNATRSALFPGEQPEDLINQAIRTEIDSRLKAPQYPRVYNPNCSGNHCTVETDEVRVLRLGKSPDQGNLIICHSCFLHEMRYRRSRNLKLSEEAKFELPDWNSLPVYS